VYIQRVLTLALLVLSIAACSPWERVPQSMPGPVGADLDHRRWTREARVYESLETVALFSTTLLSEPMQKALLRTLNTEVPGRSPLDQLGFELPATQATALVIVSGRRRGWEILAEPQSPWSIELAVDDQRASPLRAVPLSVPVTFERWFPAWNPWSRAWLLVFPVAASSLDGPARLTFAAAGGISADFVWP
jgi:hypothetical protein